MTIIIAVLVELNVVLAKSAVQMERVYALQEFWEILKIVEHVATSAAPIRNALVVLVYATMDLLWHC